MADNSDTRPALFLKTGSGRAPTRTPAGGQRPANVAGTSTPVPSSWSDDVSQTPPSLLFKVADDDHLPALASEACLPVNFTAIGFEKPPNFHPLGTTTDGTGQSSPPPLPRRRCIDLPFEDEVVLNSPETLTGALQDMSLAPDAQSDARPKEKWFGSH